jgi:hypothetical protein
MFGPTVISYYVITEILAPNQSALFGGIDRAIMDTSGQSVLPGSYILSTTNLPVLLKLNLTLQ